MISQTETNSEPKTTSPIEASSNKFKETGTLRNRLLSTVLPATLIPLVIASAIGYSITERRTRTLSLNLLEEQTRVASNTVAVFINDSFDVLDLVSLNSDVIEAMKASSQQTQTLGLSPEKIQEAEAKFANTKTLESNPILNNYLQRIVSSTLTTEIFFTEANGFNVAYSNPPSDFVQSDEAWWQTAKQKGRAIDEPEFDESAKTSVIALSEAVKDPQTGEFLGVIKAGIPVTELNEILASYLSPSLEESQTVQVVNANAKDINTALVSTINSEGSDSEQQLIGDEPVFQVAQILADSLENSRSLDEVKQIIQERGNYSNLSLKQEEIFSQPALIAEFEYEGKLYDLETVPNTNLVTITAIDSAFVAAAARRLLTAFAIVAIILGAIAIGLILVLARQLSQPLTNLSDKAQEVAAGNLDARASVGGTLETMTLANNFNNLVERVQNLLQEQQALTDEQRQEKERLEREIFQLLEEIGDATEGDLTVRASLTSMEMSTVSDLFNAIIDSLQEIAIEAKRSTGQVGSSLKESEQAIRQLAERAIAEAEETGNTLAAIEQMSKSIQEVAQNANQAAAIADNTNNTVLESSNAMDRTVNSILSLRTTVGDTAKKMKRLGESSQKISQVVALIEEIALKTNLLAINASVEASRAGEQGQGFTVVAEQVGALAEQSAAATKEIASIVAAIQAETQEVSQAMELGTTQVVDTTRMVESTKQSLTLVLERSQEINQLMSSIAQATVSQTSTSETVTKLMQQIAQLSQASSESSKQVAETMVTTAQIAQKLENAVARFKVADENSTQVYS